MRGRKIILAVAAGLLLGMAGGAAWWWFRLRPEPPPESLPCGAVAVRQNGATEIRGLTIDHLPTMAEWAALTAACRGREAAVSGSIRLPHRAETTAFSGLLTPESDGAWRADLTAEIDGKNEKVTTCRLPANGLMTASFPVYFDDEKEVVFFDGSVLKKLSGLLHVEMTAEMTEEKTALKTLIAMPFDRVAAELGNAAFTVDGASFRNGNWAIAGEAELPGGAAVWEMTLTGTGGAWSWKGALVPFPGASALPVRGEIVGGAWEFATVAPAEMRVEMPRAAWWFDNVEAVGKGDAVTLTGSLRALTGDGMTASAGMFRADGRNGAWAWQLRMPELRMTLEGRPFLFTDAEWRIEGERFTLRAKRATCFREETSIQLTEVEVGGAWKDGTATAETWSGALRYRLGSERLLTAESWRAERTEQGWRGTFQQGSFKNGGIEWRAEAGEWRREASGTTVSFPAGSASGNGYAETRLAEVQLTAAENGSVRELRAGSIEGEREGFGAFSLKDARWSPGEMTAREAKVTVDGRVWTVSCSIPGKVVGKADPGEMTDAFEAETALAADGTVTFKGRCGGAAFADGEFLFRGTAKRSDLLATLSAEAELPAARVEQPLPMAFFGLAGFFTGRCAASGDFALMRKPRFRGTWKLSGEVTAAGGAGTFSGVEAEIDPETAVFRVARLVHPSFSAADGIVELTGAERALKVIAFTRGGGRWNWLSVEGVSLRFSVTGIDAAALHPALKGAFSTPLSGTVVTEGLGLVFADLHAEAEGEIQLESLEPFRYLPEKGVNPEVFECAAALGRRFLFDRLTLSLRRHGETGKLLLHITAAGRPAEAIPFVPTETGFRRTRAGETGFFGRCELGGDYLLPAAEVPKP